MFQSSFLWTVVLVLRNAGTVVDGHVDEARCAADGGIGCQAEEDDDMGLVQRQTRKLHDQSEPESPLGKCPKLVKKVSDYRACFEQGKEAEVSGLIGQFPEYNFDFPSDDKDCNTIDEDCMFGSGAAPPGPGPLAFSASSDDLSVLLTLQSRRLKRAGKEFTEEEAGIRFTAALTSLIGFSRSFLLGDFETQHPTVIPFIVRTSPKKPLAPTVPTFSFFTEFINEVLKVQPRIPLDVTKNLTLTYAFNSNPIAAFSIVAGCNEEKVQASGFGIRKSKKKFEEALVDDITEAECSDEFIDTINFLNDETSYKGKYTPDDCILVFFKQVNNKKLPLTPASLRALYWVCFDASAFFTGNGFSFSGMVNPINEVPFAATTAMQSFQGRELVVRTVAVKDLMKESPDDVTVLRFPTIPNVTTTAENGMFNRDFYNFLEQGFFPFKKPQA